MEIKEVQSDNELKLFIDLPWSIYKGDGNWVPPLKLEISEKLDKRGHPFYRHGWASTFLAIDEGKVIGRILVADDPRYNAENKTNIGTFGFFESINSQQVANALFDKAESVLQSRGRSKMVGPMEYSTNYECGTLIEGFEYPPRIMMPYNPSYYQALYENSGFQKSRDLLSWWFEKETHQVERIRPIAQRLASRSNVTIRPFILSDFDNEVRRCMRVYDSMRKDWWWSCVSLTAEEISYLAKQLRRVTHPRHTLIAEIDGEPVGFSLTLPDINEAIRPLNGELSWCGIPYLALPRLLWRMNKIKTARMAVLCVLPAYQKRGIAEQLILETLDYGANQLRYTGAELGWTDENNDSVSKIITRAGAKPYKRYRIYERSF